MNGRSLTVRLWVGLMALATVGSVTASSGAVGGLFGSTVCISPAVFLAIAVTPVDSIAEAVTSRLPLEPTES